jgi:protein SCO1/2
VIAAGVVLFAACGGGDRELAGLTRDPAPVVDALAVPDASRDGEEFRFVAPDDGLLVVFFGYTSCPDVCPTTLADLRRALDDLTDDGAEDGDDRADRIEMVMVTVDPDRDRDVVTDYVQGFVPGAHAVVIDDDTELRELAESFGVSYQVTERANGDIDVVHSDTTLFAVDDTGTLVLTWPFGTTSDELAGDLRQLLDTRTE